MTLIATIVITILRRFLFMLMSIIIIVFRMIAMVLTRRIVRIMLLRWRNMILLMPLQWHRPRKDITISFITTAIICVIARVTAKIIFFLLFKATVADKAMVVLVHHRHRHRLVDTS